MTAASHDRPLYASFLRQVELRPDHEALRVEGRSLDYRALFEEAASIAATLQAHDSGAGQLTGVLARRSVTTYAGLLAALLRGHGYVPLNPKHPRDRVGSIIERTELSSILVDERGEKLLPDLVSEEPRLWVLPHRDDVSDLTERWPSHRWIGRGEMAPASSWRDPDASPEDIAYVLFTSGSTGEPKGVVLEHRNVNAFVDGVRERWTPTHEDRISQMPEVSFDGSVFDIFQCWDVGATLCVPSDMDLLKPADFIVREKLTVWTFVPSMAGIMLRLKLLEPGAFPLLRASMFGGEVLPQSVAEAWSKAAPHSFVENHYGPTETTVSVSSYRWREDSPAECHDGALPIGTPFGKTTCRILDPEGREVAPGEAGELWVAGPQVARGYWRDPVRTDRSFCVPPGSDVRHYRTGDRVLRPAEGGPMIFIGRIDDQLQVRGHRVEMGEVEGVLRDAVDALVVAMGWPEHVVGTADGIVAFIQGSESEVDLDEVRAAMDRNLPEYMCPREYIFMDQLPTNPNGKVDRLLLKGMLEERDSASGQGS
jgi:amino acid adenylation domain-containing protein